MRDDDNSDACDEAPRAEEKCYTKGRLRDEFRMKPAPGVEPVRMYKSPYGGKYGVWRLADCVPMRAKRPQTEKQRQANARLGLQARMKSERGRFAMLAHTWLALDPVFLDTETTGLDAGAQALEIGLVNARGERIFETRLKPTVGIDPTAAAVHGSGLLKWEAMPDRAGSSHLYLVNRYSEQKESAEELSRRVIRGTFEGWYE
jgi:DNA polymerase-3 subunit epsilon